MNVCYNQVLIYFLFTWKSCKANFQLWPDLHQPISLLPSSSLTQRMKRTSGSRGRSGLRSASSCSGSSTARSSDGRRRREPDKKFGGRTTCSSGRDWESRASAPCPWFRGTPAMICRSNLSTKVGRRLRGRSLQTTFGVTSAATLEWCSSFCLFSVWRHRNWILKMSLP